MSKRLLPTISLLSALLEANPVPCKAGLVMNADLSKAFPYGYESPDQSCTAAYSLVAEGGGMIGKEVGEGFGIPTDAHGDFAPEPDKVYSWRGWPGDRATPSAPPSDAPAGFISIAEHEERLGAASKEIADLKAELAKPAKKAVGEMQQRAEKAEAEVKRLQEESAAAAARAGELRGKVGDLREAIAAKDEERVNAALVALGIEPPTEQEGDN